MCYVVVCFEVSNGARIIYFDAYCVDRVHYAAKMVDVKVSNPVRTQHYELCMPFHRCGTANQIAQTGCTRDRLCPSTVKNVTSVRLDTLQVSLIKKNRRRRL